MKSRQPLKTLIFYHTRRSSVNPFKAFSQAVFTGITVALLKPVFRKTTFWPCKCLKSLCAIRQNLWATISSKVEIYHCFNSLQFYFPEYGFYPGSDALRRNLSFLVHHSTVPSFNYSLSKFAIGLINIYDVNRL